MATQTLRAVLCVGLLMLGSGIRAEERLFAPFDDVRLDGVRQDGPGAGGLSSFVFAGGQDWPAIRLSSTVPLDWSHSGALVIPVENPGALPVRLLVRLDDSPTADGGDASLTGLTTVPPHTSGSVVLPLDAAPVGMRARPPGAVVPQPGDMTIADVRGSVDLRHVVAMHISGVRDAADRTLFIGRTTLRGRDPRQVSGGPIVDRFGQTLQGTWPEKIGSEAELRARLASAQADTRRLAREASPLADRYGGVDASTRLRATGFFRAEKHDGRWTLITPAGHRFFSLGVDAVLAQNPTLVTGRESLFEGLPTASSPLARYFGTEPAGRTFDVGRANLERAFGPDWPARWRTEAVERLKAWGFNTLGNWSDAAPSQSAAMPHVTFYDVEGGSADISMANGRSLPDPFDARFVEVADRVAATMTATRRDDPFLIGYFSGNELPWGTPDRPADGVTARVLALGPESAAKQALLADLRGRYATVLGFATAWALPAPATWEALLAAPLPWPQRPTPAALHDAAAFEGRFADLYFRTVAGAIKRHDPNHLYLGTRFASYTPAIVAACARWCDVLSFNVYGATPGIVSDVWRPLDRPVLIGEFHFGSADRGPFWPGMVDVGEEARRGPAYATYLAAAVADPDVVGAHWYQYADEPVTGRPYDGENGHIGLVAVTGIPFAGFVSAVAAANRAAMDAFAATRPRLRGTAE